MSALLEQLTCGWGAEEEEEEEGLQRRGCARGRRRLAAERVLQCVLLPALWKVC